MRDREGRNHRLLAALLAFVLCCARANAAPWTTLVSLPDGAYPQAMALRSGGGLISAGTDYSGPWLVSIDGAGSVAWNEVVEESGSRARRDVRDLVGTPDGGGTVLLARVSPAATHPTTILHFDSSGAVAWARSWTVGTRDEPRKLVQLSDGGYLVAIEDLVARQLVLTRLDAWGGRVWAKAVAGVTNHGAMALAPAADGGFLLAIGGTEATCILRGTSDGQVTWCRSLELPFLSDAAPLPISVTFTEAPDGDWLLAGSSPFTGCAAVASRLDAAGEPRWSLGYVAEGTNAPTVSVTSDSGFLISHWDGLTRLAPDGAWQWTQLADWRDEYNFRFGALTSGDEILVGGQYRDQAAFARIDISGNPASCLRFGADGWTPFDLSLTASPIACTLVDVAANGDPSGPWAIRPLDPGSPCASQCRADWSEPDDSASQARKALHERTTLGGNFCDDAEDWLRFDACAGATLSIQTDGLASAADTVIDLFAADRVTLLASDDNGGEGLGSSLAWNATSSGPLYARIRQADGSAGPDRSYRVTAVVSPSPARTFIKAVGPPGDHLRLDAAIGEGGATLISGIVGLIPGTKLWLTSVAPDGSIAWDTAWTLGDFRGRPVKPMMRADGGSYIGFTPDQPDPDRFMLSRRAPDGSEMWSRKYVPGADSAYPWTATLANDGGVLLAGACRTGDGPGTWIASVTPGGALAWERAIGDGTFTSGALRVATNPAGDVFIVGSRNLTKLDAAGDVLWDRIVPGPWYETVVAPSPDGGVYRVNAEVLRFDATGNLLWQRALPLTTLTAPGPASATADGGLLVTLNSWNQAHFKILRLDASGNVAWTRRVDPLEGTHAAVSIRELPSGDIVVAVDSYVELDTNPAARVIRLTRDGWLESPCSAVSSQIMTLAASSVVVEIGSSVSRPIAGSLVDVSYPLADVLTHERDECDCACGSESAPAEVSPVAGDQPLVIDAKGHIAWERRDRSDACWFNIYRGRLSELASGDHGQCVAAGVGLNETVDSSPPPPDDAWFYLVTGESAAGEGPLGPDSLGSPRATTSPCP